MEALKQEYLRTRSKRAEDAICAALCPVVTKDVQFWLRDRGMHEHTRDDMESWALGAIAGALRTYNNSSSIRSYVLKRVRYAAIEALRDETGFRKKAHTLARFFHLPRDHDTQTGTNPSAPEGYMPEPADDRDNIKRLEAAMLVCDYLSALSERERDIIRSVYINSEERQSVAKRMGVCPSRITQIVKKAFASIRERVRRKGDRDE